MASYHLTVKIVSRSGARSAVAAAAYRSRAEMVDDRQGLTFDYTKKKDLVHSEIILPAGAPERLADRSVLWNEVESRENRKDAQLAREIEVALPKELNLEEQITLLREYVQEEFVSQGMIADINIHHYKDNPHAHILLTTRRVNEQGFAEKVRDWNKKELVMRWRERWAIKQNEKLLAAGHDSRVDHRSFAERNIDLIPQRHIGYNLKFVPKEYLNFEKITLDNVEEYVLIKHANGEKIINDPDKAIQYLTHYNVAFKEEDIDLFLYVHTYGTAQFEEAKEKLLNSPELKEIGISEDGETLYTTRTMLLKETMMFQQVEILERSINHPVASEIVRQTLANYTLDEDQKNAFQAVMNSGDISMVMGRAGSGKSYTLSAIREAYEAQGYRVRGIALAGISAENMENSSGIASTTIYSQLQKWDQGIDHMTPKDILVVDEVGFVGTRQMHAITSQVREAGAKVIMIGDNEQLPAIEAGGAARGIMERVGYSELSTVKRQELEWQKEATALMSSAENRMKDAISIYDQHGQIKELAKREDAKDQLIKDWKEYTLQNPQKSSLILTYSNADVKDLNLRAREEQKAAGKLATQEYSITTEKGPKLFAEGERIMFLENNRGMGVKNGSLGTILKIDKSTDHSFLVKLDNDRMVTFDPGQYRNIDYGYAMTVHKSQGSTVDRSFVLATKRFDKHATYVAMSRHRENATLYHGKDDFKDREAFIKAVEKRNVKSLVEDFANQRGYETVEKVPEPEQFKKVSISGREYLEVPKGDLKEPITGEYRGDIQYQGQNYNRIESIDNSKRYLVPATGQGVSQQLRLQDVVYDGKSVLKAPGKLPDISQGKAIDKTIERLLER